MSRALLFCRKTLKPDKLSGLLRELACGSSTYPRNIS
jgi:hypothetical protein